MTTILDYAPMMTAFKTMLETVSIIEDTATVSLSVSIGDENILNLGKNHFAIIEPGTFAHLLENNEIAGAITITFDYFRRIQGSVPNAKTSFVAMRDAIVNKVVKRPTLGQYGVVRVNGIETAGEIYNLMDDQGGGPFFIGQTINVRYLASDFIELLETPY